MDFITLGLMAVSSQLHHIDGFHTEYPKMLGLLVEGLKDSQKDLTAIGVDAIIVGDYDAACRLLEMANSVGYSGDENTSERQALLEQALEIAVVSYSRFAHMSLLTKMGESATIIASLFLILNKRDLGKQWYKIAESDFQKFVDEVKAPPTNFEKLIENDFVRMGLIAMPGIPMLSSLRTWRLTGMSKQNQITELSDDNNWQNYGLGFWETAKLFSSLKDWKNGYKTALEAYHVESEKVKEALNNLKDLNNSIQ